MCLFIATSNKGRAQADEYTVGISSSERWMLTKNIQTAYVEGFDADARRGSTGIDREVPPSEQRGVDIQ